MNGLVLHRVEVNGALVDVRMSNGMVTEVGRVDADDDVVDGNGGALIPGLWDHHIHLMALAAAKASVAAGPPSVTTRPELAAALARADRSVPGDGWLRAVGYHESVAGDLDRYALDQFVERRPVRVQHRSGALWILNSRAVAAAGLDAAEHPGIERDAAGRPTGRVFGADRWLRDRMGSGERPSLGEVGRLLARYGIVGVTDTTPYETAAELDDLAGAVAASAFSPHVVATGGPRLSESVFPPPLRRGPVKIVVGDHKLPELDALAADIATAHRHDRPVAVHIVTRVALVLALSAWEMAGAAAGDRIEHGSVIPDELCEPIGRLGLTVITQPNFVHERGDEYLADVDADDQPHLYRCGSLLAAGIPVAGSTDAPFGEPDPWRAMAAAIDRRTRTGACVVPEEAVSPRRALDLFLGPPHSPGGPARPIRPRSPADLCLLDAPLADVLSDPVSDRVAMTLIGGSVAYRR